MIRRSPTITRADRFAWAMKRNATIAWAVGLGYILAIFWLTGDYSPLP